MGKIIFEAPTTNSCVKYEQNRFRDAMQPLSSEHNYSHVSTRHNIKHILGVYKVKINPKHVPWWGGGSGFVSFHSLGVMPLQKLFGSSLKKMQRFDISNARGPAYNYLGSTNRISQQLYTLFY